VVADAGPIAALHVQSWQTAYAGIMPADFLAQISVAEKAEWWRRQLAEVSSGVCVALTGDSVIGFVAAGPSRDADGAGKCAVYALHVSPDHRGRGIGRRLLRAAESVSPPGAEITLWVLAQNEPAQGFYRASGFTSDGARKQIVIAAAELTELRFTRKPTADRA
jgi:ribosomal protein S18 acetylase RimI-like enzyme